MVCNFSHVARENCAVILPFLQLLIDFRDGNSVLEFVTKCFPFQVPESGVDKNKM